MKPRVRRARFVGSIGHPGRCLAWRETKKGEGVARGGAEPPQCDCALQQGRLGAIRIDADSIALLPHSNQFSQHTLRGQLPAPAFTRAHRLL